jgi:ankyrin repeat protein
MRMTRLTFLRTILTGAASLAGLARAGAAGATVLSGATAGRGAGAAAGPPAGPGGGAGGGALGLPAGDLDSQKFRRAVVEGDLGRVEAYLRADPALAGSRDERGKSVLVLACLAGRRAVANRLRQGLPGGLDLIEAILMGESARVSELLAKLPALANEPQPFGGTAAHAAARAGHPDLLFPLSLAGASWNLASTDPPGLTALRLAIEHPDRAAAEEMADTMLGNGADPNAPQADGVTPLHAAAAAGSTETIRLLVLDGARVDARTPRGETALDRARSAGHPAAAEMLADERRLPRSHRTSRFAYDAAGGRFTARDNPPLPPPVISEYVATAHGNLARVRELLALYPGLLLVNAPWNELAVEAGAHTGFKDGVRLQLDQGAPLSICTAAMMGMAERVRALLAEDPQRLWECGAHNIPLIWYPAIGGASPVQVEITRLLVARGADVTAQKRGHTALHWAARAGAHDLAALLLDHGADPNAVSRFAGSELTPLALAEKSGDKPTIDLLWGRGAKA